MADEQHVFWLSFADEARGFLGACLVEVDEDDLEAVREELEEAFPHRLPGSEWLAAAVRKAHDMECNPGGDIASHEIPPEGWPAFEQMPRHRLLQKSELKRLGIIMHEEAPHE